MPKQIILEAPELSVKLNRDEKQEYFRVCLEIWGCIPVDVNWAKGTNIYKRFLIEEKQ
jgi:hypothetical protein